MSIDVHVNEPQSPPVYRDVRVLRWVGQVAVVTVVLGVLYWLYTNYITNLRASGLPTGFDFLGFQFRSAIPGLEDSAQYSILRAFGAGYLNTVRVIVVGIPACTILGILIGVARLSENRLVRLVGTLYVESFRNIPVLLWIFFASLVVFTENIPSITEEVEPFGISVFSNRGVAIPWFDPESSVIVFVGFLLLGLMAAGATAWYRARVSERTGAPARGGLFGLAVFAVFVILGNVVAEAPLALEVPSIDGRQIVGGLSIAVPYLALTLALTLYTASHVAEIVRGAIQAVPKGQTEAASAIALTTYQRYRFVILPQAFRIMIPPLASQYLNLTKNSSLGVAISYIEITSIFARISNNSTPALQALFILMALYLTFSLGISAIANFFNRRLALVTR